MRRSEGDTPHRIAVPNSRRHHENAEIILPAQRRLRRVGRLWRLGRLDQACSTTVSTILTASTAATAPTAYLCSRMSAIATSPTTLRERALTLSKVSSGV